jgi:hypothetical protein
VTYDYLIKRDCHDCKVKPGEPHKGGCDVERCPLCGGQLLTCSCIYELSGLKRDCLEKDHPDIYENGPTVEMYMKLDIEFDKVGGRLPWTGIWPGVEECVEFGWYSKRARIGYRRCGPFDVGAGPDLSRLVSEGIWSRQKRRWERPS